MGILYADDAAVVSRSPDGLVRMLNAIVRAFEAFRVTRYGDSADAGTNATDWGATNNTSTSTGHRSSGSDAGTHHEVTKVYWLITEDAEHTHEINN